MQNCFNTMGKLLGLITIPQPFLTLGPFLEVLWGAFHPHGYFLSHEGWRLSNSRSSMPSEGLLALSFMSSDLFSTLSQCEGLEFPFDCHTPLFDIRAKVFDTGLILFFCQALASRTPSNIEDGCDVIQDNILGDI